MENYGLGTHGDKMCPDTSIGNTSNTPQFIRPICPNWDILKKKPYHMSIVHVLP